MPYEELTQEQQVGKWINRLRFKSNIWEKGPSERDTSYIIETVIKIRKVCGITPLGNSYYNEIDFVRSGLIFCNIFAEDYKYALKEFKALIWGDW